MHGTGDPRSPQRVARIVHGAIVAGLILVFAVLSFLLGALETGLDSGTARILVVAGYVVLVGDFVVAKFLRDRIQAGPPGADPDDWWRERLGLAITLWAVLEAAGLIPIMLGFVAGDRILQAVAIAVSVVFLYLTRPSALERG